MFAGYAECAATGIDAERVLQAIQILSQTCIDVCRGQALEAEVAGALDIAEETYYEIVRLKTAGVCRAAAEIGAVLGGGDSRSVSALGAYGEALGIAFQIIDDVLEYAGDGDKLGKPLDSDLRNQRITLPLIYALNDGEDCRAALVAMLASTHDRRDSLAQLLQQHGAITHARRTAESFTRVARRHLHLLPASDARARLRSWTLDVVDRDH
jgi:geranylgeranyl pyrophosphate synthase